jgi:response regulator RpfG family c-di-GMP phosphodiesterase
LYLGVSTERKPLTVLCVDDDVHLLLARAAILKHHGSKILSAQNGAEMLKLV